jgi:hypothetical protein
MSLYIIWLMPPGNGQVARLLQSNLQYNLPSYIPKASAPELGIYMEM